MKTFSILIADDHSVVRHGVRSLLEMNPGWKVVAQARDSREAVQMARGLKPDLVVLDIGMPLLNGLEAARQIAHDLPETRLLILSMYDSEELIEKAIREDNCSAQKGGQWWKLEGRAETATNRGDLSALAFWQGEAG